MKYPCNTIKDLLPLYHDEVCSNESIKIVTDHLVQCAECKKYYEMMKESNQMFQEIGIEEKADVHMIKRIKKKLKRGKIITATVSLGIGIFLVLGIFEFMNCYIVPVEYSQENFKVEEENGQLHISITGDSIHNLNKKVIQDGDKSNLYFYGDTTLAQKYLVANFNETKKYTLEYIDNNLNEGPMGYTIDNVYYLVEDYSELDGELDDSVDNAILLWSKNKIQ